jgi:hypothetical protein
VPRCEEFPEVIADKDGEVIVHVHAASLKPIDKQLPADRIMQAGGELPRVCGSDGVGRKPPPAIALRRARHYGHCEDWLILAGRKR